MGSPSPNGSDGAVLWESADHHGYRAEPLLDLTDELLQIYATTHVVGKVLGAYWRQPMQIDLFIYLKVGPDPRPIQSVALARILTSIKSGGAVPIMATHQSAIDIVERIVCENLGGGYA